MPEKDYSHRDVIDKLGIKRGFAVHISRNLLTLMPELADKVSMRTEMDLAEENEQLNVVLLLMTNEDKTVDVLRYWKDRIKTDGGIWLLTFKRGYSDYIDQTSLIDAGKSAGVVDNKVCSVSDSLSAMRFVIRKEDRANRLAI